MVRYLLVAEMVEQFMRNLNGGGWYGDPNSSGMTNEGSMGEGLSQFLKPGQKKNLTTVYRSLTGNTDDPFPAFKKLLDTHFPLNSVPANFVITTGNRDNPFPLPSS